jgi:hypothetical protein
MFAFIYKMFDWLVCDQIEPSYTMHTNHLQEPSVALQWEVLSDEKPTFHVSEDYKLPWLFQKNTTDPITISDRLKEPQNLRELKSQ